MVVDFFLANLILSQGLGVVVVGKSDFKENPKSDLDFDLAFVNMIKLIRSMKSIGFTL